MHVTTWPRDDRAMQVVTWPRGDFVMQVVSWPQVAVLCNDDRTTGGCCDAKATWTQRGCVIQGLHGMQSWCDTSCYIVTARLLCDVNPTWPRGGCLVKWLHDKLLAV